MTFDSTFQKPYGLPQEPTVSVKNSVFDVIYGQASERRKAWGTFVEGKPIWFPVIQWLQVACNVILYSNTWSVVQTNELMNPIRIIYASLNTIFTLNLNAVMKMLSFKFWWKIVTCCLRLNKKKFTYDYL